MLYTESRPPEFGSKAEDDGQAPTTILPARPLYGTNIVDYIRAMHGVDMIWKPSHEGDEPPF